ncbi:amino acid transporter [Mollisia scopiformis]|uniref:Amino acid transporter n=1 Tax=Mollisia scopiformis TaxID=149040 RepID=A0A132BB61_MOLSC|nr:amino acid transporter [Mollisia scopiformis]KUJ09660.1 amino acid transporter [Mollisia scopiformis]
MDVPADRNNGQTVDSDVLALLGKKQVLKRRFGLLSIFGFAMCELITWETVLAIFSQGLDNGGPAGLVYGFLIAWLSTLSVYTVISELASMAPIAGGQYYWVYILAPTRYKKFSSYIIGWLTSLAWIATIATESVFAGTIIQGLIILDYPDTYVPKEYQGTLLTWLVIAVAILINTVIPGTLPKFEIFILVFHVAGFITIMALLWTYSTHQTASFVFTTSLNEGNWPTQGLSYCVGFLGNVATFVGADATVHMAEEISNAAINIPRAICGSMIINGILGFAMMLTVLFCIGDLTTVVGTATGFPFIQIFYDSVGSIAGATVMTAVVLALTWSCAIGITTTASRMTWSFARDRGTPFSHYLMKVDKRTKVPIIAVGAVTLFAALLTLIYIGSPTAFNDVISLTITGFYGSYFLPSAFLLYHRIKGHVASKTLHIPAATQDLPEPSHDGADGHIGDEKMKPSEDPNTSTTIPDVAIEVAQIQLAWGPFRIPGILGIINNLYACLYMIFVIFWSVWPPATPVSASTMNYSVLVTGGVIIFSVIWYWIRGRKEYQGPLIDDEVRNVIRLGSVVA